MKKRFVIFIVMVGILIGIIIVTNISLDSAPTATEVVNRGATVTMKKGDDIMVVLKWSGNNNQKGLPDLNLFMDDPCNSLKNPSFFFSHDSFNEVSCNGGTGKRIGGSSDDPIESVVWNNPPTGDYDVIIWQVCSGAECYEIERGLPIDYTLDVMSDGKRKLFKGVSLFGDNPTVIRVKLVN